MKFHIIIPKLLKGIIYRTVIQGLEEFKKREKKALFIEVTLTQSLLFFKFDAEILVVEAAFLLLFKDF